MSVSFEDLSSQADTEVLIVAKLTSHIDSNNDAPTSKGYNPFGVGRLFRTVCMALAMFSSSVAMVASLNHFG